MRTSHLGRSLTPGTKEEYQTIIRNARAGGPSAHIENLETALKEKCLELEQKKVENKVLLKEVNEREKALELANLDLETQRDRILSISSEMEIHKSELMTVHKDRKQALEELKRAKVQSNMADRAYKAIEEKQSNLRDLKSYTDRVYELEQENSELQKQVSVRNKELRSSEHALKMLELDMERCMDKAKMIVRGEYQNTLADMEHQLHNAEEEKRMLERQVKVLNAGNLDASFNRAEEGNDSLQTELIHLRAEVKRYKGKLDLTEKRVQAESRTAEIANSRLDLLNEILQKGSHRRYKHVTPGSVSRSETGSIVCSGMMSPMPSIGTPASSYTGFSKLDEDVSESGKEKDELEHSLSTLAVDVPVGTPEHGPTAGGLDGVPPQLFELLKKEVFSLRQDLRERDRLLTDKDSVIESQMRKADKLEKVREFEQKRYKRDTTELKAELKSFRGDKPAPVIGRPTDKWNI